MAFRETGHADAEAAGIRMETLPVEALDKRDQIRSVAEVSLRPVVVRAVAWRVSAQCEDVSDAGLRVADEDRLHLRFRMADTCQVGDRRDRGGLFDAQHQVMGHFPGGAARAVGH